MRAIKGKLINVLLLFFVVSLILSICMLVPTQKVRAEQSAEAYYYTEDRSTLGMWYTGEKGTKEFRENRVYGQEGVILLNHGQVTDGNSVISKANDYSDNSDKFEALTYAHYVELPTWMSGISFEGNAGEVWNNQQLTVEERINNALITQEGLGYVKQLLYIDFDDEKNAEKDIGTPCLFIKSQAEYTFDITDDQWHVVTFYVGSAYAHEQFSYGNCMITLYDLSGNQIAQKLMEDINKDVYVSFAVKGAFKAKIDPAGYSGTALSAIFFDNLKENDQIGTSDLTATLSGAKTVELKWQNKSSDSYTNIYRRVKGESGFTFIAEVGPGVNTYQDTGTKVAMDYEYALTSGVKRIYPEDRSWDYYGYAMTGTKLEFDLGVREFNLLDMNVFASCSTAPYKMTYIEFVNENLGCQIGDTAYTTVKVYKNTQYDADGNLIDKGEPYSGRMVYFTLDGEYVYNSVEGQDVPNMKTDIYSSYTGEDGIALLVYEPPYVGNYTITARIDELPDEGDILNGYDASSVTTDFVVYAPSSETHVPSLFSISDAIKPGDAFSITGNYIMLGNENEVAYAPANGEEDRVFSEDIVDLKYLTDKDIIVEDSMFNTGVMAIFPVTEEAGIYDFWVKNKYGWSTAITMNGVRPLYMNQDGAYAGMPIEVVGRNFFGSEYGMPKESEQNVKVKLVRIGDLQGVSDGVEKEYIVPIEQGVKYSAEESFTGEEILRSNPYRIEFRVPEGVATGTYDVYVASDSVGYRKLESPQKLVVYTKVNANYSAKYFGEGEHIGNDPLDLNVYWAQDINYANVIEMPAEYRSATGDFESWGGYTQLSKANQYIQAQIDLLAGQGGGVLYFPDGHYYFAGIYIKSGVILLGESKERTIFEIAFSEEEQNFFRYISAESSNHVGIANVTITMRDMTETVADMTIIFSNCQYMFITDVDFNLPQPEKLNNRNNNRGMGLYSGSHLVYQNVKYVGEYSPLSLDNTTYTMIHNVDISMKGLSNSIGWKYAFLENTRYVSGSEGHGWSGRDTAYCAYNYIQDVGRKENCDNRGEIFYFEPPGSVTSRGYILTADSRTFTAYTENGDVITADTQLGYNQCAIQITDGTGAGQIRYFEKAPIAGKEGIVFGNTYQLCAWEDDWQVIPDHTSKFSIFESMQGHTIYKNVAHDAAKSLMLYSMCSDSVIIGNELYNTEGIQVYNDTVSTHLGTNMNVRIEGNVVDGISSGTGSGGIEVIAINGAGYFGISDIGIVIRDNTIRNLRNYEGKTGSSEHGKYNAAISLDTKENVTTFAPGAIRFVILEDNYMENCDYGIRTDARMYGVLSKNNSFKDIGSKKQDLPSGYVPNAGMATEDTTVLNTVQFHALNKLTFVVDGKEDEELSGYYTYMQTLPVLDGAFIGWAKTETVEDESEILKMNDGGVATLYPVFGYEISLQFNYKLEDGTDKGEYRNYKILSGESLTSLGRPVRVGYNFAGWYYDKDCTQAYDAEAEITGNITLYAKWESKDVSEPPANEVTPSENQKNGCSSSMSTGNLAAVLLFVSCFAGWMIIKGKHAEK